MNVTEPAQPVITGDQRMLRMADNLAQMFAQLACDKLAAGDTDNARYLAQWRTALDAMAHGEDVGTLTFPEVRPPQIVLPTVEPVQGPAPLSRPDPAR